MTFSSLLNQLRDKTSPAGLMTRTDAASVVAMEVLVEQNQIPPVRIRLERLVLSMHGPSSVSAAQEGASQAA